MKTAVGFLENAIDKYIDYVEGSHKAEPFTITQLSEAVQQAKEIEKQQIINGRITAPITTGDIELDRQEAEQYYKEEYGGEQ